MIVHLINNLTCMPAKTTQPSSRSSTATDKAFLWKHSPNFGATLVQAGVHTPADVATAQLQRQLAGSDGKAPKQGPMLTDQGGHCSILLVLGGP